MNCTFLNGYGVEGCVDENHDSNKDLEDNLSPDWKVKVINKKILHLPEEKQFFLTFPACF